MGTLLGKGDLQMRWIFWASSVTWALRGLAQYLMKMNVFSIFEAFAVVSHQKCQIR